MKRLLNTLYVTTQGAYLSREGETALVRVEDEIKLRIPIHTLDGIVCFGQVSCSPPFMGLCAERNVTVSFLSEQGKFLARVQGPVAGNVLLRREQYRRADREEDSATVAAWIVAAKLANCRTVLLRDAREHPDSDGAGALNEAARHIGKLLSAIADPRQNFSETRSCEKKPAPLDSVRGWEGDGARTYFGVFDHLIVSQKQEFHFLERSRRPPLDNMNALISFIYTLLLHDTQSALEGVGLDPAVGFLHRDRPGRPGLALDLMEEFRPFLGDRLALSLVNRQQVKGKGFTKTETGAVRMDDETRKEVLIAYQKRKQEEIQHPFLDEKIAVGLLPHAQALLLARYLRGDIDAYPPFLWK